MRSRTRAVEQRLLLKPCSSYASSAGTLHRPARDGARIWPPAEIEHYSLLIQRARANPSVHISALCRAVEFRLLERAEEPFHFRTLRCRWWQAPEQFSGSRGRLGPPPGLREREREIETRFVEIRIARERGRQRSDGRRQIASRHLQDAEVRHDHGVVGLALLRILQCAAGADEIVAAA